MRHVPFFHALDRIDIARIIGALERVHFPAGTLIFGEGTAADALYLLEAGRVAVRVRTTAAEKTLAELEAPAHFGELGLLLARRTASAFAITDVDAWKLPRPRFEHLVRERATFGLAVATALAQVIDQRSRQFVGAPTAPAIRRSIGVGEPPSARGLPVRLVGAALALGVPFVLWWLEPPSGLSSQGWHVGLILLGAAIGWLFEPLPDFVIALTMVIAWGVAGLVPLSVAFSGFASSSWLVALGALGLGASMARSGLLFRIALRFLKIFPATHIGQVLGLLIGGALVTPLVPLAIARVATIAPLTQELAQGLGYPAKSRASAGIAFAGLIGYGAFSSVFLTGLAMNFFVLDLLPPPDQARFDWLTWFVSAAPMGAVLLIGALMMLFVLFRPEVTPKTTAATLRLQEQVLGPLSRQELVTIAALVVLLLGLVLQPFLRIDSAWVALSALVLVTAGGVLDRESFRTSLEWGFLMLFGVLLGTASVLRGVGVDRWIGDALVPLARAVGSPNALVVVLGACIIVCRLVLPWIPATLLLSLALVPAAPRVGLPPWVVGFVILVAANTWLHPAQSDLYRLMRDATRGELFTIAHGVIAGIVLTCSTLIAIVLTLPYWRAIGVLGP